MNKKKHTPIQQINFLDILGDENDGRENRIRSEHEVSAFGSSQQKELESVANQDLEQMEYEQSRGNGETDVQLGNTDRFTRTNRGTSREGDRYLRDRMVASGTSPTYRNQPYTNSNEEEKAFTAPIEPYTLTELDSESFFLPKKTKAKNSIEAIKLVKHLAENNSIPSKSQQSIIAKYIGFGGIPQVFDKDNKEYSELYTSLKNTVNNDEYSSLRQSTSDSFYTNKVLCDATYNILKKSGFLAKENLTILEPSCGSGNYIGYMPKYFRDRNNIYAVELDSTAHSIAKSLYSSKNISIINKPFQEVNHINSKVDVVIGNFPFGNQIIYDKHSIQASGNNLHNYFLIKSIESLNNKGLLVAITSSQFLNQKNVNLKQEIDAIADFKGAIRLPKEAFKNANTEALCDIIIFQKNDNKIINKELYQDSEHWTNKDLLNNFNFKTDDYFVKRIGEASIETNQFGKEFINFSEDFNNIEAKINEIINENVVDVSKDFKQPLVEQKKDIIKAPHNVFVGELFLGKEGKIAKRIADFRDEPRGEICNIPNSKLAKFQDFIYLKESLKSVLEAEVSSNGVSASEKEIFEHRKELNINYNNFVSNHGNLGSRNNKHLFLDDVKGRLVLGLEAKNKLGKVVPASIMSKRLVKPKEVNITSLEDAIYYCVAERGCVSISYISNLQELNYQGNEEQLIKDITDKNLAYLNPVNNTWEIAEQYLSGNILDKIKDIENYIGDEDVTRNLQALKKVTPKRIPFSEIGFSLESNWIPQKYKTDWINQTLADGKDCIDTFEYEPLTSAYNIKINEYSCLNTFNKNEFGTQRMSGAEIITRVLKNRSLAIQDTAIDEDGNTVHIFNHLETELVNDKKNLLMQKFYDDLATNPVKSKEIENIYNDLFNGFVAPSYTKGNQLLLQNSNDDITLRPHQKQAVLRGILEDRYLLDHSVGAGKTYTMIATIMERKRLGLNHKPLIIVPNHLLGQWRDSFYELYPNANILTADEKNFSKDKREEFIGNCALNDWDCIIMSHSSFEKLPLDNKYIQKHIEKELELIDNIMLESNDKRGFVFKQLKKVKEAYASKLKSLTNGQSKDTLINFNTIGIDELYVDEAHEFKNLQFHTKKGNIAGINPKGSNKAYDLYMKCQFIQEVKFNKTGKNNKGVFFATGTPISNSLAELYTISRYLDGKTLDNLDVSHFDAWSSNFAETQVEWQVSSTGKGFEKKEMFSQFKNIPELSKLYLQYADVVTNTDIQHYIKLPEILNNKANNITVEPTLSQKEYMNEIVKRMEKVKQREVLPTEDNPLKICSDGRKSSIDMRVIDPLAESSNKVLHLTNSVKDIYDKWQDDKGTQLIFCDISTPKGKSNTISNEKLSFMENEQLINGNIVVETSFKNNFSVYTDIKEKLVNSGVLEEEIAFIHDYDTLEKKSALFEKVNNGSIRVLLGSSAKMGAGMNVQERLVALHHLDAPWRPTDLEQREGRIIRQGNKLLEKYGKSFKVSINRYATKNMYDSRLWQILENKAKFIQQFRVGSIKNRTGEDIGSDGAEVKSAEEMKAIASGNPYLLLYIKLQAELKKQTNIHKRNMVNKNILIKNVTSFNNGEHEKYNQVNEHLQTCGAVKHNGNYNFEVVRVPKHTTITERNSKIVIYDGNEVLTDLQIKNRKEKFPEILDKCIANLNTSKEKIELDMKVAKENLQKPIDNTIVLTLQQDLDKCKTVMEEYEDNKEAYFIPKCKGFDSEINQINKLFNKDNSKVQGLER